MQLCFIASLSPNALSAQVKAGSGIINQRNDVNNKKMAEPHKRHV